MENKAISKQAHLVNIYKDMQLDKQICVIGDFETIQKKMTKWFSEDKAIPCFLGCFIKDNRCYLSHPTILEPEYGLVDGIVIGDVPLLVLGYCGTEVEYKHQVAN